MRRGGKQVTRVSLSHLYLYLSVPPPLCVAEWCFWSGHSLCQSLRVATQGFGLLLEEVCEALRELFKLSP